MGVELPIADPVIQFTVLVTIVLVVKRTIERLHLPGVIGLLLVGMLIGPGGAAVLPREPVTDLLGQIGLIYIMFLAGVEIDLDIVRLNRRQTAAFGALAFGCSLLPAVAVGLALGYGWAAALLLGTLLSSHTLLAYPILLRLGLVGRPAVITAVGGTIVTDTAALVLLAIVIQGATGEGLWWGPLVSLAALAAAAVWLVPRAARRFFARGDADRPEKALFVLAVLVVLAGLAAVLGTEEILGAFLAGLCMNRPLREREDLREHVEFVGRMLFIPFFFVSTGMLLELSVLGDLFTWRLAGLMLALVLLGKLTAAWIIGAVYGYSTHDRVLIAGLTLPQAAATLAVTVTAQEAGLFEIDEVDAVIVLILVTCLAGPLLTQHAGGQLARADAPP